MEAEKLHVGSLWLQHMPRADNQSYFGYLGRREQLLMLLGSVREWFHGD